MWGIVLNNFCLLRIIIKLSSKGKSSPLKMKKVNRIGSFINAGNASDKLNFLLNQILIIFVEVVLQNIYFSSVYLQIYLSEKLDFQRNSFTYRKKFFHIFLTVKNKMIISAQIELFFLNHLFQRIKFQEIYIIIHTQY